MFDILPSRERARPWRRAMLSLLCALGVLLGGAAAANDTDTRWYALRNQGVKVGWMRLVTRADGDKLEMNDELHFAAKGQEGNFRHVMRARHDAQLSPEHFSLDIERPRKPWALEADVAGHTMTVRRHEGLPIKDSVPIKPEFATEFSAMRLAAGLKPGATRKVALLGVWEKPSVVDGELRYVGDDTVELDGQSLKTRRYVLSNPESADRTYWLDAQQRVVKMQVFGRIEMLLTDKHGAEAPEPAPAHAALAAPRKAPPPPAVRGALATSRIPAFPGASGYGAHTAGGRGGRVIEVTNLDDDGPGSLRAALEADGPRMVVFRVAGTISLSRPIEIRSPRVTVAGQSAPGDGIAVRNAGIAIATDDVVLRYLRLRPGNTGAIDPENNDALQINGGRNVVIDHVSLSWSEDEVVQVWEGAEDVTLSWCLFSEALNKSRHPKGRHGAGVLVGNGSQRVSLHHSLLANLDFRNPLIKDAGAVDVVENLVYNWGRTGGEAVDEIGREAHINVIGNRYLPGPASRAPAFVVNKGDEPASVYPRIFAQDNVGPAAVTGGDREFEMFSLGWEKQAIPRSIRATRAFEGPAIARLGQSVLESAVLAQAGATRPHRDAVDRRIVEAVRGNAGRMINSPDEVGGYPPLDAGRPMVDRDHDGMPDGWETAHGLSPEHADDAAADRDGDGYTNLEEYLQSLITP